MMCHIKSCDDSRTLNFDLKNSNNIFCCRRAKRGDNSLLWSKSPPSYYLMALLHRYKGLKRSQIRGFFTSVVLRSKEKLNPWVFTSVVLESKKKSNPWVFTTVVQDLTLMRSRVQSCIRASLVDNSVRPPSQSFGEDAPA